MELIIYRFSSRPNWRWSTGAEAPNDIAGAARLLGTGAKRRPLKGPGHATRSRFKPPNPETRELAAATSQISIFQKQNNQAPVAMDFLATSCFTCKAKKNCATL
jgi:thiol:disulfide interchange protein